MFCGSFVCVFVFASVFASCDVRVFVCVFELCASICVAAVCVVRSCVCSRLCLSSLLFRTCVCACVLVSLCVCLCRRRDVVYVCVVLGSLDEYFFSFQGKCSRGQRRNAVL